MRVKPVHILPFARTFDDTLITDLTGRDSMSDLHCVITEDDGFEINEAIVDFIPIGENEFRCVATIRHFIDEEQSETDIAIAEFKAAPERER